MWRKYHVMTVYFLSQLQQFLLFPQYFLSYRRQLFYLTLSSIYTDFNTSKKKKKKFVEKGEIAQIL